MEYQPMVNYSIGIPTGLSEREIMGGEPMVSYSTGALTSLLDKLAKPKNHPMLTEDFSKLIEDLHQDLKSLKKDLLDKFEGRRGTDEQVKVWMKQVRELVFDVEDWIDQKPVTVDMWESEREEIEGFKTQIKQAIERCRRYGLLNKAPTDPVPAHVLVPNNTAIESQRLLCEEKPGLVALDRPKSEIVEHLTDTEHKKLKVVSIVGMEGLGKTTLAKEIYSDLQGQYDFDCRAFATVGRRPSLRATLQDILRQVKPKTHRQDTKGSSDVQQVIKPKTHPQDTKGSSDVQQVITELWEYLATKRYFILIDDISSTWAWKVINCALPDKNLGSRVLTTTCIIDIAKSCCIHPGDFVYQMEALSEKDSRSLFLQKLVREEVSDNMLQMCGGKPLAINVATGLLNRRSSELAEPKMLGKCILSSSNQYTTSEGMTKILHMSYADLSVPVKSCFLYLSVFPNDYMIKKDSLIRLWRAEGFIPRRGEGGRDEESLWVTGDSYFNELIGRRLIQPVFDYDDEQAVGCTVHGVILDFIASLSSQENFVTEGAELRSGQFPCETIRRFSLDFYGDQDEDDTLASCAGSLSRVRSLAVFGDIEGMAGRSALTVLGDIGGTSVLPSFKLIRVLDLEDTDNLRSRHLQGIEGLVLLRYLGLGGTAIDKIPEEIGELEQLETIDVRQTKLSALPISIVRLKRLVCLLLDGAVELPKDIWELQGLEEVSTIGANSSSSLDSVSELLRKSEQLRVIGVRLDGLHRSDDKSVMSFLEEVSRSSKLGSLSLCCHDVDLLGLLLEVPPCQLRRFELAISGPIPGGAVNKMASLVSLTHMDIEISELDAGLIRVLGDLPNLVLLKLVSSGIRSPSGKSRKSRCNIIGEDGFRCLKVFSFKCKVGGMGLEFTSGAMPQLRRLWIVFSARETLSLYGNFDFGIEHLSSLTRVHATINCKSARAWEVKDAEAAIRQQVRKLPIEPTIEFSTTLIHRMLAGEKRETTISLRDRVKMMISSERWHRRSSSDSAASVHGGGRQAAAAGGAVVQLGSSTNRLDVLRKIKSLTLLLAILAATITYKAGVYPPGGVWPDDRDGHSAGDPRLLSTHPRRYKVFFYGNSSAFMVSLTAILMLQNEKLVKSHTTLLVSMMLDMFVIMGAYAAGSWRDVRSSIYVVAMAGGVTVYMIVHVMCITLSTTERENRRLKKRHKLLLLVAILVATITYQAGLNPPGGFRREDDDGQPAGGAVLLENYARRVRAFYCNTVSFIATITLILLLFSPNLYRLAIRCYALYPCIVLALLGLMVAYIAGSARGVQSSIYAIVLVAAVVCFIAAGTILLEKDREEEREEEEDDDDNDDEWNSAILAPAPRPRPRTRPRPRPGPRSGSRVAQETKYREVYASRKYLMLLGILAASVTYQAGLAPPGSMSQDDGDHVEAGNPVLSDRNRRRYLVFFYGNSTSYVASVFIIGLQLQQIWRRHQPRNNKLFLLVTNTAVVLDLLGLLAAYAAGTTWELENGIALAVLVLLCISIYVVPWISSFMYSPRDQEA